MDGQGKLSDTLKLGRGTGYCLNQERASFIFKSAVLKMNCAALTIAVGGVLLLLDSNIHGQDRSNAGRGQAILYRWPQGQLAVMIGCHINEIKFYLLLHLMMITDQMPMTIIWMAALNLNVTCKCWLIIQHSAKEHFGSVCLITEGIPNKEK